MYCTLYIHGESAETIRFVLEEQFGAATIKAGCCCFPHFDISLIRNKEADANKMRTYPDGFLYYEFRAELEIYEAHIQVTDAILKSLWEHHMPAVASCDYEQALNDYIFSL